jgi:hypothetical protein
MVHLQLMTMYLYFHLIYSIFIVHINQDLIKYQVKLINQVNQRQQQGDEILGYKLYQIKHEENASSTSTSQQQTSETTTPTVLSAPSSSRLNLTELTINRMKLDCNISSLIAISVTTYKDDPDIRLIAMLDHYGLIGIVDPFKNLKLCESNSPSDTEKFISINYCYGNDKICAISENGKAYLILLI